MQGSTLVKVVAAMAIIIFISALALMAYRLGGAALNWEMGEDDPVLKIYPANESLYVISASNVSLVDARGSIIWAVQYPDVLYSAYDNDTLYVYSMGRGLSAICKNGTVRGLTGKGMDHPPVIGPDGTIYLRSWGILLAIDASGKEKWNASLVVSDPVVDGSGNVYFFMRPPGRIAEVYLCCMSPDGGTLWSSYCEKYTASMKLRPASIGGVLVYDEYSGVLYHVDASGNQTWDHSMAYLGQYSLVVDEKSRLYLFYLWGTVHVLNERGEMIGKFNPVVTNNANLSYTPAVYNDTVYVIGDSGKDLATLYALDLYGSLKWNRQFNSSAAPLIYPGRDIVCIDTVSNSGGQPSPVLYVIGKDGTLKYTYSSGDGSRWEQVYIGPDDTVYAKTDGGKLYALKG
ncbi:PQQ-binding-like beta-propeller repeat protein [Methanocella conradii]|uniref:PQQ-binding-like beta-propeller repeat protein n=1 Tax=Methanocella conradii TaxID=1175444 RepID=UPI0024B3A743|nr:PQQ-binding-like beta-propeller repeat protein [Methanocella conradii]MDI6896850.1 PQQ-binding-like beta-propeller repeat protein [Methanocella conradii]